MPSFTDFALSEMVRVGSDVRNLGVPGGTVEAASNRIVDYFYREFRDRESDKQSCVLVRFYITQSYGELPDHLKLFAQRMSADIELGPRTKCLTLLATRGDEAAWNSRMASFAHQSIPLRSVEAVAKLPMIYRLVQQFGIEVSMLLEPSPDVFVEYEHKNFNVFHVAAAMGSEYIPAQEDFVLPYQVQSVLGFGGLLPMAELFAIVIFSRHPIPRESAELFKTIALNVRTSIANPVLEGKIFEPPTKHLAK